MRIFLSIFLVFLVSLDVIAQDTKLDGIQLSANAYVKLLSRRALAQHRYSDKDYLGVYANKIGPYANIMEIYSFFTQIKESPSYGLAFCPLPKGVTVQKAPTTLADRLEGDRPVLSPVFQIKFLEVVHDKVLCSRDLTAEDLDRYKAAIIKDYYYELLFDGLPVRNFLGFHRPALNPANPGYSFLFTGFDFDIAYNKDRIISVNMSVRYEDAVLLAFPNNAGGVLPVTFRYSVNWRSVDTPYSERMKLYGKSSITKDDIQIHWISIGNSFIMVLLLIGFLTFLIGRTVVKDISRYSRAARVLGSVADALERGDGEGIVISDDTKAFGGRAQKESDDEGEEDDDPEGKRKPSRASGDDEGEGDFGWKLIYADVFRFPKNKYMFSLLLGTGMQVFVCVIGLFLLSFFGVYEPEQQGRLYVSSLVLYSFSSFAGSYESNKAYKQMGGKRWAWIVIGVLLFFPTIFATVFIFMDLVAASHHSIMALRFTTMLQVALIYYVVSLPMTFLGAIIGRRYSGSFDAPCRSNPNPREIPKAPWYRSFFCHMIIAGFIPFSAIYVELFYIYSSVWGHMYFSLYFILLIVFVLLIAVTIFITISLIYFTLNSENYNWWWRSFAYGGSCSLFVICYSFFYWDWSGMNGLIQGVFYYGWILILAFLAFTMLGSLAFYGTKRFVKFIYSSVKID